MVVDEHPAHIVDSTNLQYDIIFGADFLDKCIITIDYNSNQVCWMEYNIPLHETVEFFHTVTTPIFLHPSRQLLKMTSW